MRNMYYGGLMHEVFAPRLYIARKFDTRTDARQSARERIADSYEISIYLENSGALFINGRKYFLHRGDVRFIRPGTHLKSIPEYSCYSFRFYAQSTVREIESVSEFFAGNEECIELARRVVEAFSATSGELLVQTLFFGLLYEMYTVSAGKSSKNPSAEKCTEYMNENYASDITLEKLGMLTGYVPIHISRIFKSATGMTPHEYLTDVRLAHAREALVLGSAAIDSVARECGFDSPSHFQKLFKEKFGITPGKYRKEYRD